MVELATAAHRSSLNRIGLGGSTQYSRVQAPGCRMHHALFFVTCDAVFFDRPRNAERKNPLTMERGISACPWKRGIDTLGTCISQ